MLNRRTPSRPVRRAGVLLEVMIAIALFVGAGAFALGAMNNTLNAIVYNQRQAMAVDIARSKLAELEAGLITPADLREADGTALGSITPRQLDDAAAGRWEFDVRTSPSEYGNLSLVELTITEASDDPAVDPESLVSYTIRQLIELRPDDDETYEEDDLLRGLPAP
jgi:hypothetical protein